MKILILGGSGMLGHQLWRHFNGKCETWVTLRRDAREFRDDGLFQDGRVVAGLDATDFQAVDKAIQSVRPSVVLNCVGIIKQLKEAKSAIPSITINSLLPHKLAEACKAVGARLVHFSTDCVFSGTRGAYGEDDYADAGDLYGRTKYLGEVAGPKAITLRTSIIGRELGSAYSLLDWFLSQEGKIVRGFRQAIYTGFTTVEMARIVERVVVDFTEMSGLWHVASNPINKYDLLLLVRERFGRNIIVEPDDTFRCDRSLNGTRFMAATGYRPPAWSTMIEEVAQCRSSSRPFL